MENQKNMTLYYGIGAMVVVILIILFFSFKGKNILTNTQNGAGNNTALEPASTLDISGITNGAKSVSISYTDALVKYADKRIQFDKICQASPNVVTYKDNTGIMIDNRSPQSRTIKIGTDYTVKAYGFKIITLPDVYLKSKTILVDCDKSVNVATILVQE